MGYDVFSRYLGHVNGYLLVVLGAGVVASPPQQLLLDYIILQDARLVADEQHMFIVVQEVLLEEFGYTLKFPAACLQLHQVGLGQVGHSLLIGGRYCQRIRRLDRALMREFVSLNFDHLGLLVLVAMVDAD